MSAMQAANRLRTSLLSKASQSFGAWQMLPGHHNSRTIARQGFDWVTVDCEHGNIDDGAMHEAVNAIAACGVSPIVRIPACEAWMFKRALDSGAHAVMVPLISTPEEAKKVVQFSKFPPKGVRGFGSPFPMTSFNVSTTLEYLQQANDAILTIVQIETKEALSNVNAIASTEGIDILFVGPFDLGNSIGHPITSPKLDPELVEAIESIKNAAHNAGKKVGIYCTDGAQAKMYVDKGFNMVSVAADMIAVGSYLSSALDTARGSTANAAAPTGPYGR